MPILLFAIFFLRKENDTQIDNFLAWSLCSGEPGHFGPVKVVSLVRNEVVTLTGFCNKTGSNKTGKIVKK
jgi:hypothetical protein